jgi:hypothetical protein
MIYLSAGTAATDHGARTAAPAICNTRGGLLRGLVTGALLSLTCAMPGAALGDERLEAALAVVDPPDHTEIDRIVDMLVTNDMEAEALRERLTRVYSSPDFRRRTAQVYARHLSTTELRYLARTFEHPVFRKYRSLAPALMIELAEIERDLISQFDELDEGGSDMTP